MDRFDLCPRCEGKMRLVTVALEVCLDCNHSRRIRFNYSKNWTDEAACRDQVLEDWYPTRGEDPRPAKRICARCSVRRECLAYAVALPEVHGVWGGLSGRERRRLLMDSTALWKRCIGCELWYVWHRKADQAAAFCSNRCIVEHRREIKKQKEPQ